MVDGTAARVAVRVRGLTKRFGKVTALDGVDLDVLAGGATGVLGGAGAGKSTLLRVLAGVVHPTAGSVELSADAERRDGAVAARRSIGFVDHDPRFPGWMTGREVVFFSATAHGIPRSELSERVDAALERVSLGDVAATRLTGWSAPNRRWLGLAQALVAAPSVLLLDDPFDGLESDDRARLAAVLRGREGSAVVLASRRVEDLTGTCDQTLLLADGRVTSEGPTQVVLAGLGATTYELQLDPGSGLALAGLAARLRGESWVSAVAEHGSTLRIAVSDDARASRELLPMVVATGMAVAFVQRHPSRLQE